MGVCVDGEFSPYDQTIADHAQTLASRTFHHIGVQLDWHRASSSFCGQRELSVIQVTYSLHTPIDLVPSALAYARPYEGIHIDILYDRVSGGNEVERARFWDTSWRMKSPTFCRASRAIPIPES